MIFSTLKINNDEAIYVQIENHIVNAIKNGEVYKGSKLPSTREASKVLGISRNTVIAAYEELESRGVINTLKGKGSFISAEKRQEECDYNVDWNSMINNYGSSCEKLDVMKTEYPFKKGMISFKSIAPEESLFDKDEFKRALLDVWSLEENKLLNYGYARGYKPLVDYLLEYMKNKGVNIEGKDILITNGFTEGFDIVMQSLTNKGDSIICEEPTHNTALKIMKAHELNIVQVPMDSNGIDIDILRRELQNNKIKFGYITPSYHNPTGIVMKGDRRNDVYNAFKDTSVPIIEDGFNEELLYSSSPLQPIAAIPNTGNGVIYIGSFSKILFPGLRIGWILADKGLIDTLESVKRSRTIHCSFLDQGVMYHYMKSGSFERYVKKVRKYYKDKYNFTLDKVNRYILNEYVTGEGGLHIFIKLKDNIKAREVLKLCYKKGVLFMPGDIFYDNNNGESTLRIGFGRVSEVEIDEGIKIIGEVILEIMNRNNSKI